MGMANGLVLAGLGLSGWGTLILFTFLQPEVFRPVEWSEGVWVALLMAAASRPLAVRIFKRARVALDSAFYISSVFIFGTLAGAWLALIIQTLDGLARYLGGTGMVTRRDNPWLVAAQLTQHGGLPALLLIVFSVAFGVEMGRPYDDVELAWKLPLYAFTFLSVHYFLAGGSHWFQGSAPRSLWREYFLRVVIAEMALIPLALAMVLGWLHQGLGLFGLLGATCLMFNVIFRRAIVSGDRLRRRVEELSILTKVGHIIAGSLERRALLANIATETLSLVRHTSRFMIGTLEPGSDEVVYQLFNERGEQYRQIVAPRDEGLSGWVMQHREPLLLNDAQRQYALYSKTSSYNDPRFHSWLGVPLITYSEVVGVMSVQSEQPQAYTPAHLRVLMTIADQAAVALENARLYELATVDGLTGLQVRRHFEHRLHEEWERAERYDAPFTLGIFDIDDFKALNDTYGHQLGDQVLRAAAAVVRDNMRGTDLAGRYGGEEFVFLLPRTPVSEARTVAERIRADIEALEVPYNGHIHRVTASIGLAGYPESRARGVADLITLADAAMYDAKRRGKNRVCLANPNTRPPAPKPMSEEGSLL